MKVTDRILEHGDGFWFALEFFPPTTAEALTALYGRMDRMAALGPLFVTVTWPTIASTAPGTGEICSNSQNVLSLETVMHLSSNHVDPPLLLRVLKEARESGLRNLLVQADVSLSRDRRSREGTARMVERIRSAHGDFFCIGTAAYPEGSRLGVTEGEDLADLKEIVEAGVDFVITAPFFDVARYVGWLGRLRAFGVACPVIPGMMPMNSLDHFQQMTKMNPLLDRSGEWLRIHDDLRPLKLDDEAIKHYGVDWCVGTLRRLQSHGCSGAYFYTLNLENAVTQIIHTLRNTHEPTVGGLSAVRSPANSPPGLRPANVAGIPPRMPPPGEMRALPQPSWRLTHQLRDINWDDFPNGRWGDTTSPAFACKTPHLAATPSQCRHLWSTADGLDDVIATFSGYLQGTVEALPWFEGPLVEESQTILSRLVSLTQHGFLTISSQPKVDAASSTHAVHGWGPPGGYVFQKEFLELFCSCAKVQQLLHVLEKYNEGVASKVTYIMTNLSGSHCYQNFDSPNALTWGVFPGREIIQPTTVDPALFLVWKDEAFALWTQHFGSQDVIPAVIQDIQDTWFLVSIVNNDHKGDGTLWSLFEEIIQRPDFDVSSRGCLTQLPKSLGAATPGDLPLKPAGASYADDSSSQRTGASFSTFSPDDASPTSPYPAFGSL